jgi:hypothetical protein
MIFKFYSTPDIALRVDPFLAAWKEGSKNTPVYVAEGGRG